MVKNADSSRPNGDAPPEVKDPLTTSLLLAGLSLSIYLFGLCAGGLMISGDYNGRAAAENFILTTFTCFGASVILAIASCFTYPRARFLARFMLLVHILTILTIAYVVRRNP